MGIFNKIFRGQCDTNSNNTSSEISKEKNSGSILTIKILGIGCKNCENLTDNVKIALQKLNREANIDKITDIGEISSYGIISTPGLVINDKVVSYGKVLKPEDIVKIIEKI
ncbi:thioredoxin family protein [Fusobacterium sp. PH5-44]|uniref:thioredoxin family protein n=1 Tax=unclassified Fusobacterium TaxID=2648384 RepID=UPI003D232455